ncbi:MAG: hypothetical protein EA357_01035 [Micavibrio sp.]|nr:MAG: hypothetical protein EA357_01035 [Micavibrio sp.]
MAQEKTISEYEVMFTIRTGVTVLTPKIREFDGINGDALCFHVNGDDALQIETPDALLILKDLQRDYLEEAVERGFLMFYELEDDEVVRCTPCQIRNQKN